MARRIAIVEDEAAIRDNYSDALRRQGYEVDGYASRKAALAVFESRLPDLVIIDIGLGDEPEGGFELCRVLRGRSRSLPVIFLTARDSDLDAISGLRLGADDYLTKDITLPHLLARVAALFRRTDALAISNENEEKVQTGPLLLEMDRMRCTWHGTVVDLTVTEFWVIHSLARRPGHVKSREQLMDDANAVVDGATITSHIKRIRRKFEVLDQAFDCIETVYGMGYRWRCAA